MTTTQQQTKKHTIDARGKRLGRVASEAAHYLMGKHETGFARHIASGTAVSIEHAASLLIPEPKRKAKTYFRYSGYPGGLKSESMEQVIKKKGYAEVLRRAVYGMLPANKLRPKMMKHLHVIE